MNQPVHLQYQLSESLWRRFLDAHYRADPRLRTRFFWGVVCIVIGCLGFGGFYNHPLVAALLLATGFFGVLSRPLLVQKGLRQARHHPFFGQQISISVSEEQLRVRSGSSGYDQPWSNFAGYKLLAPGFLLYHDRQSFFFIPRGILDADHLEQLQQLLAAAAVPRW